MQAPPISQHQAQQMLEWLQTMTFSRTPKNLSRDFSDGVLMAQIMKYQYPTLVQLHNYQPTNSSASKYINWKILNQKIFKKFGFIIHRNDIQNIISCVPGTIQKVLHMIYTKILIYQQNTIQIQKNQTTNLTNKLSQISNNKKLSSSIEQQNHNIFARQLSSQLAQKQDIIKQLRQTIDILETKMKKMQQLNKLKDNKIDSLMKKLDQSIGL